MVESNIALQQSILTWAESAGLDKSAICQQPVTAPYVEKTLLQSVAKQTVCVSKKSCCGGPCVPKQ